jgi:preprotein translocase subunit SecA
MQFQHADADSTVAAPPPAAPAQAAAPPSAAQPPGRPLAPTPPAPAAPGPPRPDTFVRELPKVGRNDPCPCGSGKKYKQCHGRLS